MAKQAEQRIDAGRPPRLQRAGLFLGPLLAVAVYAVLPDSFRDASGEVVPFSPAGHATAGLAAWMAVWWMTEALPISATAMLPIALLPLLGAGSVGEATAPYAHPLIFLFLGGFLLSLAMQRWGLHRRVALLALVVVGGEPRRIVAGFMAVSAGLSMWVSNTATAVMMLPIGLSVIERVEAAGGEGHGRAFSLCLLLGIAYGASIGGIGTLIGTPPNLVLASFAESRLGRPIGFAEWMTVGVPLVLVFLPLAWWVLTRVVFRVELPSVPGGRRFARDALREMGRIRPAERRTAFVFVATASAWVLRPLLVKLELCGVAPLAGLTDTGIAILAGLALFALPAGEKVEDEPSQAGEPGGRVMDWETARHVPFGLLLLFGGGLSLAGAIQREGVGDWIGSQVGSLAGSPPLLLIAVVTALVILLTEITSNTATTAALLPILAGLAPGLDLPPLALLVPAALAASCAFMLPVATPPNAVVFGSGRIRVPEMVRAGVWLNVLGVALITALTSALALPLLGVPLR